MMYEHNIESNILEESFKEYLTENRTVNLCMFSGELKDILKCIVGHNAVRSMTYSGNKIETIKSKYNLY